MNSSESPDRFPAEGTCAVSFGGSRYQLTANRMAGGKGLKVFARELGGMDFISFNAYCLGGQWQVKPCEMPLSKVEAFLKGYQRLDE